MRNPYKNSCISLLTKILFSLIFSLIGCICYSQVSFGVKSGINIATTRDLIESPKNRIGWHAAGFAILPLYKQFFLQPELLYSSKGDRSNNQVGSSNIVTRFNYLNFPILLGYKIDYNTFLLFGPEIGYLTSAKLKIEGSESLINVSKNYAPKFDIGLDIGLRHKIIKNIGIEVLYNYGFKILYTIDGAGVIHDETKGANRVFQIGINYVL